MQGIILILIQFKISCEKGTILGFWVYDFSALSLNFGILGIETHNEMLD